MRPQGGGAPRQPPQPPVSLPDHLSHGSSTAYHAPWRCRCGECQEWRRSYDRERGELQVKRLWCKVGDRVRITVSFGTEARGGFCLPAGSAGTVAVVHTTMNGRGYGVLLDDDPEQLPAYYDGSELEEEVT